MRPMGVDTFEAREGWVPANTEGSVWCYRTRGNAGVLAFRRTDDGKRLYEATHQDCYASDETITTTRRVEAVRFAARGPVAPAPGAASDTPSEPREPPATPTATPSSPAIKLAMRAAWDQYIDATSQFLKHIKANLDTSAHGDLMGTVDQALALCHDGAPKTADTPRAEPEALSGTLSAVLRKAHDLIAEHDAADAN